MIELTLPFPPTVNTYWRTPNSGRLAGRTLLSSKARAFREEALLAVQRATRRERVCGRLQVTMVIHPPDRRRRDLDNLTKGVLDALQHSGVIEDDGDIDDLRIIRSDVRAHGAVRVTIAEVGHDR